ncbi:MAG: IS30 family transposase [Verrucomicrobia bacterium]|nr:IS30 family transposase [Verrucomicrobiota bacterium]
MARYTQLTEGERNQIYVLRKHGYTLKSIARAIGRSAGTVSRELRRNEGERGYRPAQAQRMARERRRRACSHPKMTPEVVSYVEERLRQEWSPEQISGRMKMETGARVSHERIYQHVRADRKAGGSLHLHLRHGQRRRKRRCHPNPNGGGRGQIRNRRDISERPASVRFRTEIGHWEIDTIIGKGHRGAAVTIVDRASRYTLVRSVKRRTADEVTWATISLLTPFALSVRSITADNGKEFAWHELIAGLLEADFYFATPYRSWERGCPCHR